MKNSLLQNLLILFFASSTPSCFGQNVIFHHPGGGVIPDWTHSDHVPTTLMDRGLFWVLDPDITSDYITTKEMNLNYFGNVTLSFDINSIGTGAPAIAKIAVSYTGYGGTFTEIHNITATPIFQNKTIQLNNVSRNVVIRFYNSNFTNDYSNPGAGLGLKNIKLTAQNKPFIANKIYKGEYNQPLENGSLDVLGEIDQWKRLFGFLPEGIIFDKQGPEFNGIPTQAGTFEVKIAGSQENVMSNEASLMFVIDKAKQTQDNLADIYTMGFEQTFSLPSHTAEGYEISYTTSDLDKVEIDGYNIYTTNLGDVTIHAEAFGDENFKDFRKNIRLRIEDYDDVRCKVDDFNDIYNEGLTFENEDGEDVLWENNNNFTSLGNVYEAKGAIRLGSETSSGHLVSNNISEFTGRNILVRFNTRTWDNTTGSVIVRVGDDERVLEIPEISNGLPYITHQLVFNNLQPDQNLSFISPTTGDKRIYLDDISVCEATYTEWKDAYWTNGTPSENVRVKVISDLELFANLKMKSLEVENSATVTVKDGSSLYVKEGITNRGTSANFIIEKNANLIQESDLAINVGDFTVMQNSSPMILNDATLWSSPVNGQNLRNFSNQTLLKRFYKYNESTNKFASLFVNDPLYPNDNLVNEATYNFETGLGYHIRVGTNHQANAASEFEGKFIGNLNNGRYPVQVTQDNFGYNLIGNPYPSTIDANQFLISNHNVNSIYFWTQEAPLTTNGYANNNYSSYTILGGVKAASGGVTPTNMISKGQGFFVKVNYSSDVIFSNALRIPSQNVVMHRNQDQSNAKKLWLDLFEEQTPKNQILIGYTDFSTNEFDHQIDGEMFKMYDGSKLYSFIENSSENYIIQGRAIQTLNEDVIKLGFEAKNDGNYKIKANQFENFEHQNVYLVDHINHKTINLANSDYSFYSKTGTYNHQFSIVFNEGLLDNINQELSTNKLIISNSNNGLKITSTKEMKSYEIYDVIGRLLKQKKIDGNEHWITDVQPAKQLLIIKVQTIDNENISNKVLY